MRGNGGQPEVVGSEQPEERAVRAGRRPGVRALPSPRSGEEAAWFFRGLLLGLALAVLAWVVIGAVILLILIAAGTVA
jgi:hypothetical protein